MDETGTVEFLALEFNALGRRRNGGEDGHRKGNGKNGRFHGKLLKVGQRMGEVCTGKRAGRKRKRFHTMEECFGGFHTMETGFPDNGHMF